MSPGGGAGRLRARAAPGPKAKPGGRGRISPQEEIIGQLAASADVVAALDAVAEATSGAGLWEGEEAAEESVGPEGVDPLLEERYDDDLDGRSGDDEEGSPFDAQPALRVRPKPWIRFYRSGGEVGHELPQEEHLRSRAEGLSRDHREAIDTLIARQEALADYLLEHHRAYLEGRWTFIRPRPAHEIAEAVTNGDLSRLGNLTQNAFVELPDGGLRPVKDFQTTGHADPSLLTLMEDRFDRLQRCLDDGTCTRRIAACALLHSGTAIPCPKSPTQKECDRTKVLLEILGVRLTEHRQLAKRQGARRDGR